MASRKRKGPTFALFFQGDPRVEKRVYTVKHETLEPPSSVVLWIECPFCQGEVKAYLWSLSGGGKRCDCGAILSRHGHAVHWREGGEQCE